MLAPQRRYKIVRKVKNQDSKPRFQGDWGTYYQNFDLSRNSSIRSFYQQYLLKSIETNLIYTLQTSKVTNIRLPSVRGGHVDRGQNLIFFCGSNFFDCLLLKDFAPLIFADERRWRKLLCIILIHNYWKTKSGRHTVVARW